MLQLTTSTHRVFIFYIHWGNWHSSIVEGVQKIGIQSEAYLTRALLAMSFLRCDKNGICTYVFGMPIGPQTVSNEIEYNTSSKKRLPYNFLSKNSEQRIDYELPLESTKSPSRQSFDPGFGACCVTDTRNTSTRDLQWRDKQRSREGVQFILQWKSRPEVNKWSPVEKVQANLSHWNIRIICKRDPESPGSV